MITCTHLPTLFAKLLSQPFGFVSAAEGFVFLSAFLAGGIYTRIAHDQSPAAMRVALWRRARTIYLAHAGVLAVLFTAVSALAVSTGSVAVQNLASFYLKEPGTAVWAGFALLYNPPLLDILPMYVLFMLVSPLLLSVALRRGWVPVLAASLALWAAAQFGLSSFVHRELFEAFHIRVPLRESGAFNLLAWQWVWVLGLWLGSGGASKLLNCPRGVIAGAVLVAVCGLLARHLLGQYPFAAHEAYNVLVDKWQLGPLRVLNFLALLVVLTRFGAPLARMRWRFLEVLGAASLPVFCAQLIIVLFALCAVGDREVAAPLWEQVRLLAATLTALYAVAVMSAGSKQRRRAARSESGLSAGAA